MKSIRLKNTQRNHPAAVLLGGLWWLLLCTTHPALGQIVVEDDLKRSVTLEAPATRIVSLAPHVTENLYAAGAGGQVVGAVEYSDYPPAAAELPRVGSYAGVNLEALLALKPDLVVAWPEGNRARDLERIRAFGIPLFHSNPRSLAAVADSIEALGRLAGTSARASAAAERYRARLAALQAQARAGRTVTVFYQVWDRPLITLNGAQLVSEVMRLCGGRNVFSDLAAAAPQVSHEQVLARDPEVILLGGDPDARSHWRTAWERWPGLRAVAGQQVHFVNPDHLQRASPRILDGAESVCALLDAARARRDNAPEKTRGE